ncbi:mitochondrial ribosomal protein S26 [Tachypleus tridentatus]|uniref:mitochondrial ribosomal protein S26 n=1 Tax=Tachypleus tridentatus TaxID=6853 RepID=UPI003FD1CF53
MTSHNQSFNYNSHKAASTIVKNILPKRNYLITKIPLSLDQIKVQVQFIRYKKRPIPARKKIWEPPAPSKYFRISPKPVIPLKEQEELKRLNDIYRTYFRALRNLAQDPLYALTILPSSLLDDLHWWLNKTYMSLGVLLLPLYPMCLYSQILTLAIDLFRVNMRKQLDLVLLLLKKMKEEVSEHSFLMEQNRLENERVAKIREERRKCDMAKFEDEFSQAQLSLSHLIQEERKKLDELVLKEKKMNSTYVTSQTLEAAIEDALDHPTTYDFAIDLKGIINRDDKKESSCV